MPHRLSTADPDFPDRFAAFLAVRREPEADVRAVVAGILADVRARGDEAVCAYTRRFDAVEVTPETLRIRDDEIAAAAAAVPEDQHEALRLAAARIEAFHRRQMPEDSAYVDDSGIGLGSRWTAIAAVGVYVPGGLAAYPSSVLMNVIPARVAGVERIAMAVPTPRGRLSPLVLAAARLAGVGEIYRIGGAQAVGALAYGTASVAAVDKIVGPGNAYVAEAKRQVFGTVGIDMIAGPSEILVVADGRNDPGWIAADLLSQAEHDAVAQSILVTDDAGFAEAVERAIQGHLTTLETRARAAASWRDHGAVIRVGTLAEAPALIDRIAPEHLELAVAEPEALLRKVRNAGSVFLGRYTPEAVGDYVAGPNHVLPTGRSARFSSGLGVLDFVKRTTFVHCDAGGLAAVGRAAMTLAAAEGLPAHALSLGIRLNLPSPGPARTDEP